MIRIVSRRWRRAHTHRPGVYYVIFRRVYFVIFPRANLPMGVKAISTFLSVYCPGIRCWWSTPVHSMFGSSRPNVAPLQPILLNTSEKPCAVESTLFSPPAFDCRGPFVLALHEVNPIPLGSTIYRYGTSTGC